MDICIISQHFRIKMCHGWCVHCTAESQSFCTQSFFLLRLSFRVFLCVVMNLRAIGFNQAVGWFWPCPAFLRITPSSLQFRPRRGRAVYVVTSSQHCGIISYSSPILNFLVNTFWKTPTVMMQSSSAFDNCRRNSSCCFHRTKKLREKQLRRCDCCLPSAERRAALQSVRGNALTLCERASKRRAHFTRRNVTHHHRSP